MLLKLKILAAFILCSSCCLAQIPLLNSYPSITNKVIYLDFDGQVVSGTSWNSGNTVNALPSTMNAANILQIWKRMSEDYSPFDVNITTDSTRFNNAPPNRRIRVVITPTSAWYGSAGGVAYVGSFTWGGTPGTPCWVFENQLGYNPKNIAEAASHEVGHTLTLRHQSVYSSATCSKTAEYNPGTGTGVTSWAPIMGVGYSKNVTVWYNGKSATSCTLTQNDHGNVPAGITSPNYLSFLPDDVGNTFSTSKILNLSSVNLLDSGLITQPSDIDAYRFTICNNRHVSIGVKPWALDTVNYQGANLDVRLHLYDAANNLLAVDTPLTRLHSLIGINLAPGAYYFTIDGGGSANYSDYGSLGRYYIRIKATNPPALVNTILTPSNVCAGQSAALSYSSNGTPTQWQWTITGPSAATFSVQNPSFSPASGLYTISLLATSSSSMSCPTLATLNVNSAPSLTVNPVSALICPGRNTTLTVAGASSYTWLPGGFSGSTQIVTPSVTTIYTINASNGACSGSAVSSVTVSPDFTLSATISSSLVCTGQSISIQPGGATGYTLNPGNLQGNAFTLTPAFSANYQLIGENAGCKKNIGIPVTVTTPFNINLNLTDSVLCPGNSATITASGATSYTFDPGGISGNMIVVSPNGTTSYTVTALKSNNACTVDTTFLVAVRPCDYTGLREKDPELQARIFPNPASGMVFIETGAKLRGIEIYNSLGQAVYMQNGSDKLTQISTATWPRGVYLIRLFSAEQVIYTEKLLID